MDIFDEIICCMKAEASSTGNVFVRRKDLAEFMNEPLASRPVQQQTVPPVAKPQPPPVAIPETEPEPPMPAMTALPDLANMGWQELHQCALQCSACPLAPTRKNVVFGCGSQQTELMFIGEGPGADEDEQGVPFVGKAGELLTKMIRAMKYDRSEVYIANIVKCRPPGNRNPSDEEAAICLPILKRQIELVNPKAIVLLGAVPLKYLMGMTGITRQRGKWMEYNGIQVMPTYHPAYLLRNPAAKADVWKDLQQVMAYLGKL
ncbi:MAG: uracil-DNA glycosylase [Lentisphaeria bacterium]|nr:uracil-DNA glycosylase [Lentisphaeria bacterium]